MKNIYKELYCAQVFNNGKVTHYYGYINQAIRIRKKMRTPFLYHVIEKSEGYMDSNDEFSGVSDVGP